MLDQRSRATRTGPDLDGLIDQLDAVLLDLDAAVLAHSAQIEAVAPEHRRGAINLVHYVALRHHDIRSLQNDLMDLGVTSLATTEADVVAKVQAARHILSRLRGDQDPWDLGLVDTALHEGDEILTSHATALFGPQRPERPTRIMVTLPSEAADEADLVLAMVTAGMDVARINCAHDGPPAWTQMVGHIRAAEVATGRSVRIAMDVAGPKLRTGPICDGPAVGRARVRRDGSGQLLEPAVLRLVPATDPVVPSAAVSAGGREPLTVGVDPAWLAARRRGDVVALTDTRGRQRAFTVTDVAAHEVRAAGPRGAYVANGTELHTPDGGSSVAYGIPPLPQRLALAVGHRLLLTCDLTPVHPPAAGGVARIGCTLPEAVNALQVGQPVFLDDGAIDAVVESTGVGEATLVVTRTKPGGQWLGAEKGINLPETDLPLPALTPLDASLLPFIAAHADLLDVSFVRSVADIHQVLQALDAVPAPDLGLVLKIETAQGFQHLPALLLAAMHRKRLGVMVARGDLAVEVGFERLSEVPRQILALCEAAHVPAIWATQVLETLAKTGRASRAEVTDAAAAQRSDCVMLNKGPHVLDAITALDDILARMSEVQRKSRTLLRRIHSWDDQ